MGPNELEFEWFVPKTGPQFALKGESKTVITHKRSFHTNCPYTRTALEHKLSLCTTCPHISGLGGWYIPGIYEVLIQSVCAQNGFVVYRSSMLFFLFSFFLSLSGMDGIDPHIAARTRPQVQLSRSACDRGTYVSTYVLTYVPYVAVFAS